MNIKHFLAGTLAAMTILSIGGGTLLSPAPARAATDAEYQAQIAALLAQIAAIQAQLSGTTTGSCYVFTTDLTLGSTGESVRALQVYLNNKGYLVATAGVGSKGNESTYFGGLTRVALAKYQAGVGITPAAGYFGPVTRAKVNADCAPTTGGGGTGTAPTSTVLTGGEADLSDFRLRREQSSGAEGESDIEFATASFDVDDGDVRIERLELMASSTDASLNIQPWRFFDRINVLVDGREVAGKDADTRSAWNEVRKGVYRMTITNLNQVVREGDRAELTLAADITGSIDTQDLAQEFAFSIEDRGIRATDGAGIQQYIGNGNASVSFGFDNEQNGDLRITSSSDDPDASILVADRNKESRDYTVFAFDIDNKDDVDAVITDLKLTVADLNVGVDADDVLRRATLVVGRDSYQGDITASGIEFDDLDINVDANGSEKIELRVRLVRNATSTPISFSVDNADLEAEGVRSGDNADVSGSASSEIHAIAFSGIEVTPISANAKTLGENDTVGQYVISFKVKAIDEDAFIATTSNATGTVGVTYVIDGATFTGTANSVISSSASQNGGFYRVSKGSSETFTLTVTLDPAAQGTFSIRVGNIRFGENASFTGSTAYDVSSNQSLRTQPLTILD